MKRLTVLLHLVQIPLEFLFGTVDIWIRGIHVAGQDTWPLLQDHTHSAHTEVSQVFEGSRYTKDIFHRRVYKKKVKKKKSLSCLKINLNYHMRPLFI